VGQDSILSVLDGSLAYSDLEILNFEATAPTTLQVR